MKGFDHSKLGPLLLKEMSSPRLAAGVEEPTPIVAICGRPGLRTLRRHHELSFASEAMSCAALSVPHSVIRQLSCERHVLLMEKDEALVSLPNPPVREDEDAVNVANADVVARYKSGRLRDLDGEGINIMVVDTGVSEHPDLPKDQIRAIDFTDEGETRDLHGHGTAICSQLIGTGRYPGLVQGATVWSARIFDSKGVTKLSRMMAAFNVAIEDQIKDISMSLGGPSPNPIIGYAMRRLTLEGITLVAAAGNSGPAPGSIAYPAGYPEVLAVAALHKDGRLADFSSRGEPGQALMKPDLAAEGVEIVMAASPDGSMGRPIAPGYCAASGTSFSAPIIAALAAMVLQALGPNTTPARVRDALCQSASRP